MFEYKLQLGCLLVVLFITISYIKETLDKKSPCNKFFDALLYVAPWAIVFDGVTAWTVNHMDIVPEWFNLGAHALFFICMEITSVIIFLYMIDQIIGIKNKKVLRLLLAPGVLALILIVAFLPQLYYVEGASTNYSMGWSVYVCFACLFVHYFVICVMLYIKYNYLEKRKTLSIITFMLITMSILIIQIFLPEVLLSSLIPMIALVGIYVSMENPSYKRLQKYNEDMVTGFATLVENRDNSTGGHIMRTTDYVKIILHEMKKDAKYRDILTKDYLNHVTNAAPMHDIGKIATPDYILQKPGKLTDEEYAIMKQHSSIGGEIIRETFADLEEPEYQKIAYEVARHHHEKWNGRGYPDGLKGEEIPLHARIMAIADVFDAVSAKRCYRDAMPIEKCFQIIEEGIGTDFDPDLARKFLNAREKVLACYEHSKASNPDK